MKRIVMFVALAVLLIAACSPSANDPRGAVISFLNAVHSSDTLGILRGVTLKAAYTLLADTGLDTTTARADTVMLARLVQALTSGGSIWDRWVDKRTVIGDVEMRGKDSALVEVSFLSQRTGIQYYNKFGLVKNNNFWQIYSFHTQTGPQP